MTAPALLRALDGPLTRTLRRVPGGFGLGQVPERVKPDGATTLVCGFCSTGCGLQANLRGVEASVLAPATRHPVNRGSACPKGWEALRVLDAPDRATTPLLRAHGRLVPVDWERALGAFVSGFRGVLDAHGPESVAFLGTGQIVTEELALFGALARFGMGLRHGDANTRQCMATAVTAYKQSFGFDAPPYSYADLEEADVLVFVGANPCIAHPILWQRVCRSARRPKVVVIDPRRTETAVAASHHLAIRPKSDLVLLYGLAHVLLREGWIDRAYVDAHTIGFDEFAAHVAAFSPERVAAATGIEAERVAEVARLIHDHDRVSFWWTMGVNQSHEGTRVAQAIIDLALMTGSLGRPGTGANSITGQCNAMGSRLFSNTTNLLGGHDFANPADRAKVAGILAIDEARIPRNAGMAYPEIVDGIATGAIRGLWIVGTNPAHSWIGQDDFRELLGRLEFLVVQDMYHSTETARQAHLVLPAAGWGEKEGTFINSERRIGMVKRVRRAPGEALADFEIFRLVAEAWGCGETFAAWDSPEAVFRILQRLSAGQPCDITGIDGYRMLDECGGVQWPWPAGSTGTPPVERRLFEDGRFHHADGRARFVFEAPRATPELPDAGYPLWLLTGRGSASQWHTETRTAKSAVLRSLHPADPYVEVHPDDALALGIESGALVLVESRRARVSARAFVTPTVGAGQVFLPMHYEVTNRLTDPVFDPYSRQPSYKACAVRVRIPEPWEASS